MKSYVFDIDGTICTLTNGNYESAKPMTDRIESINRLYDLGHTITFHTARGMNRHKNNQEMATKEFYKITENQLSEWGVKYHYLFMGKPAGDVYVDDKACKDLEWFSLIDNALGE